MPRVSEAAALTWRDIETEADDSGRLLIRRSQTVPRVRVRWCSFPPRPWRRSGDSQPLAGVARAGKRHQPRSHPGAPLHPSCKPQQPEPTHPALSLSPCDVLTNGTSTAGGEGGAGPAWCEPHRCGDNAARRAHARPWYRAGALPLVLPDLDPRAGGPRLPPGSRLRRCRPFRRERPVMYRWSCHQRASCTASPASLKPRRPRAPPPLRPCT